MVRLLIVDDEQMVLNAMRRILKNNYEIVTLCGTDTVTEALANKGPFDAVISDFMMPGNLTGADVLNLARGYYPQIGCILHSGGALGDVQLPDIVRDHCPPGTVLLNKPASSEATVAALRQVLPQG